MSLVTHSSWEKRSADAVLTLPEPRNRSCGRNDGPVFFSLCTESETTDSVPSDEESAEVSTPAAMPPDSARGPRCY